MVAPGGNVVEAESHLLDVLVVRDDVECDVEELRPRVANEGNDLVVCRTYVVLKLKVDAAVGALVRDVTAIGLDQRSGDLRAVVGLLDSRHVPWCLDRPERFGFETGFSDKEIHIAGLRERCGCCFSNTDVVEGCHASIQQEGELFTTVVFDARDRIAFIPKRQNAGGIGGVRDLHVATQQLIGPGSPLRHGEEFEPVDDPGLSPVVRIAHQDGLLVLGAALDHVWTSADR